MKLPARVHRWGRRRQRGQHWKLAGFDVTELCRFLPDFRGHNRYLRSRDRKKAPTLP